MRISILIVICTMAALPQIALAQTPPPAIQTAAQPQTTPDPAAAAPSAASSTSGFIDFGARTTSVAGDGARYERYRDMGNGLFLDTFRLQLARGNWFVNTAVDHAARKDGRYVVSATRPGVFKAWGSWDEIPMLMSRTTQTIYTSPSPGVFRLDDSFQQALQAAPAAQQTGILTNFVNANAAPFTTESRRHIGDGGLSYMPDASTTLNLDIEHTNREGVIPFGATFGLSNAIELPVPVDHTLSDVTASGERAQGRWLFRIGYTGSWFANAVPSITWDNPYRITDSATAPSQGQMALAPSNTYADVNGFVSVRLPAHSRATASVSFGTFGDRGATILPQTINTALPVIPLQRTDVDGHAQSRSANMTFTSHPYKFMNVDVRYRYYDYDNQTPTYTNTSRIAYDTTLEVLSPPSVTSRYGGKRASLDADVTVHKLGSTFGAGYTMNQAGYDDRIFSSSTENTARLTYDAFNSQYLSLHSKYEHSVRTGSGLDTSEIAADGEQPGIRTFDIANRNRDLFTMTGSITPISSLSISVSAGAGQDRYPQSEFGLFNAKHHLYSIGVDAVPSDRVTMGASFDLEDYQTLQWSRSASPGAQFTDPSRDWSDNSHDHVQSALANLVIVKIASRVDLRLNLDYTHGRTMYIYGLGSVLDRTADMSTPVATTLPTPSQLPDVTSTLTRGTLDAVYNLTKKVGIGLTYWYEQYLVDDFALDAQAIPRINLPTALLIGYQYLPYTAHTAWGRVTVRW